MKSILEKGHSWVLDSLSYEEELVLNLIELKIGRETSLVIGDSSIDGVRPLTPTSESMKVQISFDWYISWQCINESACSGFGDEIIESSGFISVLAKSEYLSYIVKNHGWYQEVQDKPVKHYRIWSEDEVIDVIAFSDPKIVQVNA